MTALTALRSSIRRRRVWCVVMGSGEGWRASFAEEGAHRRDDFVALRRREFGEHRQRDDLARGLLGHRTAPFAIPEVGEAGLLVEGQRVVDRVADAARREMRLER